MDTKIDYQRIGMISLWLIIGSIFIYSKRDTEIISAFISTTKDFYRESINSGSDEKRVTLPTKQRINIKIDSWTPLPSEKKSFSAKGYNGSDWIITSVDVEFTAPQKVRRTFRAIPMHDNERVFIGPKRAFEIFGEVGDYEVEGKSVRLIEAYGYKN